MPARLVSMDACTARGVGPEFCFTARRRSRLVHLGRRLVTCLRRRGGGERS